MKVCVCVIDRLLPHIFVFSCRLLHTVVIWNKAAHLRRISSFDENGISPLKHKLINNHSKAYIRKWSEVGWSGRKRVGEKAIKAWQLPDADSSLSRAVCNHPRKPSVCLKLHPRMFIIFLGIFLLSMFRPMDTTLLLKGSLL